jgi:putative transposase
MVHDFHIEANNLPCLRCFDVEFSQRMSPFLAFHRLLYICKDLVSEALTFLPLMACSQASLAAEILFLRKQLAFYQERKVKPRRFDDAARLSMLLLSKLFDWKNALINVTPATFTGWHKKAFQLFWRWKSRGGRPQLPRNIRRLIAEMATQNPTWGQERVADELSLKLGILVSPRTVKKYWPEGVSSGPRRVSSQRWKTFVHNHASALVACDFATVVTATFRRLYVLVVMEIGTRKILHCNVTAHPTAEWTAQQFREAIPSDHSYRFLIHDRDGIFSAEVDQTIENLGLKVVRMPVRAPQANAYCERLIGTMRRECLDFMIPFGEKHLRTILREWLRHYNHGRPHRSLGPGLPVPSSKPKAFTEISRHCLPPGYRVMTNSILGGLHHEYELKKVAA